MERKPQACCRNGGMALTRRDKLSSGAASSSRPTPSRPQKHVGVFGRRTRDEGSPPPPSGKGPKKGPLSELSACGKGPKKGPLSELSASLVVLSDSDELLAAAFGDLALDACAPRAVIEEIDELELS